MVTPPWKTKKTEVGLVTKYFLFFFNFTVFVSTCSLNFNFRLSTFVLFPSSVNKIFALVLFQCNSSPSPYKPIPAYQRFFCCACMFFTCLRGMSYHKLSFWRLDNREIIFFYPFATII